MTDWEQTLSTARWFGGKGRGGRVTAIADLPWYTAEDVAPAVRSELLTVTYPDGDTETYQVLSAYAGRDEGEPADATEDPAALRLTVDALRDWPGAEWIDAAAVEPGASVRRLQGEQSNTTLLVGDGALFKLFRKVEPGANLDIEVLEALNDSPATPDLYGAVRSEGFDLGYFMQRVPQARDGWEWATERAAALDDITHESKALGIALRDVHDRLAKAFGTRGAGGDDLADTMVTRLGKAVADAPVLAPMADALAGRFDSLRGQQVVTQRVHGDFHLGQCLLSPTGWTIIDFEGEPMKTLAERKAFDSVWRDVAGMVRSFDYARSACASPESPEALAWSTAAREAFLAGYTGGVTPPALLDAYVIDKAVYEVVYEVRNRPDWVRIPLRAVHDEAEREAPSARLEQE